VQISKQSYEKTLIHLKSYKQKQTSLLVILMSLSYLWNFSISYLACKTVGRCTMIPHWKHFHLNKSQ